MIEDIFDFNLEYYPRRVIYYYSIHCIKLDPDMDAVSAMMVIPIVSKQAHLLGILYDLYHVPNIMDHGYVFNMGEMSKLFYVGYILDQYGLWSKAFRYIVNIEADKDVENYLNILSSIEIYQWDRLQVELEILANKVVEKYSGIRGRVEKTLEKILEAEKQFERIYVIFGLNPIRGLYGSLPYYDNEQAVVTIFTQFNEREDRVIDLIMHEVIHGLLRINKIELVMGDEEIEEEFIDTLCPEGYLSKLLGLAENISKGEGYIRTVIHQYFSEKLYEKDISLIRFIKEKINSGYLI